MHDPVNSPQHYASGAVECIDAIEASMSAEAFKVFLKGNIQKYVWRYEEKGGVESLQKAQWYLTRLIATVADKPAEEETTWHHVPDYLPASGVCLTRASDGFCPMPNTRIGPSEPVGAFDLSH
jgi:hypothetical protein